MLAVIFMLRLEATARASENPLTRSTSQAGQLRGSLT